MLALCLMLLGTYYAQNYAGIIGRSLSGTQGFTANLVSANFSCNPDHKVLVNLCYVYPIPLRVAIHNRSRLLYLCILASTYSYCT